MTRSFRALIVVLTLAFALIVFAPEVKASYSLTADEAVSLICSYDWDCETALAVAWRESNWQPHAYNAGCSCAGLFQIHRVHGHSLSTLFDPEMNTEIAYQLWLKEGWRPWRTN